MDFSLEQISDFYPGIKQARLQEEFSRYCELESLKGNYSLELVHQKFLEKLNKGTPLAYITNQAYFYNAWYYVDENVLIPRFETEGLLVLVKEIFKGKRLCEVGSGSGCLGLSLLREFDIPVELTFVDICEKALEVTKLNYNNHRYSFHPDHKVDFILGDRLENVTDRSFDLIFSNPPYVKRSQIVHDITKKYEPDTALFLEDESHDQWFLDFFKMAQAISPSLVLEGHEYNLQDVKLLALDSGYKIANVSADLNGRDRYLELHKS